MTTLEEVNREIAPLCAQLIRWKKVRNTFSTVNRLSPEVLVHIFKALPIDEHPTRFLMIKPPWIPLMEVCTYWRDLICQTPTLWRSVSLCNTDWAQLSLERSRPCTIDVTVPEREDGSRTDIDMAILIPHIARVRALHFVGLPFDGMQGLNTFLLESFSILEVLEIASWLESVDNVVDFELEVTAARFPNIRFLSLASTAAPREPVMYSDLRSLVLNSCQFDSTSMDEFIQLLSHAVHLEELELFCTIPVSSPASRTFEQKAVTLPQLKRLKIVEISLKGTINLLARLSLPGVDEVQLQPTITETTEADFVATYPSLLPFGSVRCFPWVEHATYVDLEVSGDVYNIKSGDRPKEFVPSHRHFQICLDSGDRRIWDTTLPHGMDNLIRIFRGAPIQAFELYGDLDAVNVGSWTALFEAFPTLARLYLMGAGEGLTKNMWTALRCASGGSGRAVCPALRRIKFISDTDEEACDQPLLVTDDRVFTSEEMLSCLQYRADNGARLEYLGFFDMDSEPTETNVAQLKALVDELDITSRDPAWNS